MKKTPLRRKTPLRPASYLTRGTPMKRVNRARREANHARAYGGQDRLDWLHRQACIVSGERPVECAHIKSGGMGRKSDAAYTVPLTPALHRELHAIGRSSFEWKFGINLREAAALVEKRWQREREAQ